MAGRRLTPVESGVSIPGDFAFSADALTTEVRAQRTRGLVKSKAEVSRPEARTWQTAATATVSGVPGLVTLLGSGEGGSSESSGSLSRLAGFGDGI